MSEPKRKTLTFLSRHAPYGTDHARTCFDLVLASSAFEQDVNYVFLDDGVFQLLKHQQSQGIKQKNLASALGALEVYGISQVFVDEASLQARSLVPDQLVINVVLIDSSRLQTLIRDADVVFNL